MYDRVLTSLYPDRYDLAEQHSVEIVSGWWLGINYRRRNIQDIIESPHWIMTPLGQVKLSELKP